MLEKEKEKVMCEIGLKEDIPPSVNLKLRSILKNLRASQSELHFILRDKFSPRKFWFHNIIMSNHADRKTIVCEVFENQRYYPLGGWSDAVLPLDWEVIYSLFVLFKENLSISLFSSQLLHNSAPHIHY